MSLGPLGPLGPLALGSLRIRVKGQPPILILRSLSHTDEWAALDVPGVRAVKRHATAPPSAVPLLQGVREEPTARRTDSEHPCYNALKRTATPCKTPHIYADYTGGQTDSCASTLGKRD